jgi:hypothetical protein
MRSHLIEEFEEEYNEGKLNELSGCALPFFESHWEDLVSFMRRFAPMIGEENIDQLIKLFILHYNMPFDMGLYMRAQRQFIEHSIMEDNPHMSPEAKREAVANWIRENAQKHRHEVILKQVLCLDKIKEEVLPIVQAAIEEARKNPGKEMPPLGMLMK